MATYTTSSRIIARYKKPDGMYSGFSPITMKTPTRIRISAIMWKSRRSPHNAKKHLYFMLTAVD